MRQLAEQFLDLAGKQGDMVPLMVAHRMMGTTLLNIGDLVQSRKQFDRALNLFDPATHRPVTTRFGSDHRMSVWSNRSLALWLLGYAEAAVADSDNALSDARKLGQDASLMYALLHGSLLHILCRDYVSARTITDELVTLAEAKGSLFWRAHGILVRGQLLALTKSPEDAVPSLTAGITAWRTTGSTLWLPMHLSSLASAYAELRRLDEAWQCVSEATSAIGETGEGLYEAEVNRVAGEIALRQRDELKARAYFERALAIARSQQSKSWELRAAMSMARPWRDQGKRDEACELLTPVYGWFTEGFDTLDLKEAKALLDELVA
jgi:predicted ATPase